MERKFCERENCGAEINRVNANYCPQCGSELERRNYLADNVYIVGSSLLGAALMGGIALMGVDNIYQASKTEI